MITKIVRLLFVAILVLVTIGSPSVVRAQSADNIDLYTISVHPQPDGKLLMDYRLDNYCTTSNWPTDMPYLQIGAPNSNFEIKSWGGEGKVKVKDATPQGELVQVNFDESALPQNGDCFTLYFEILQSGMYHRDPENQNITYELIPAGWNFPINVSKITIKWDLPADPAQIKITDPAPSTDGNTMVWTWDNPQMDNSQMFRGTTIKLAYAPDAFTLPIEPTAAPFFPQDSGSGNQGGGVDPFVAFLIVIAILAVAALIIGLTMAMFSNGPGSDSHDEDYSPSPIYIPTSSVSRRSSSSDDKPSHRESSYTPSYTPSYHAPSYSPPSYSSPSHSSSPGGFGSSSGMSSGCVHSSCACACACAGGGKVGCFRKAIGIGISCLKKAITKVTEIGPA